MNTTSAHAFSGSLHSSTIFAFDMKSVLINFV